MGDLLSLLDRERYRRTFLWFDVGNDNLFSLPQTIRTTFERTRTLVNVGKRRRHLAEGGQSGQHDEQTHEPQQSHISAAQLISLLRAAAQHSTVV